MFPEKLKGSFFSLGSADLRNTKSAVLELSEADGFDTAYEIILRHFNRMVPGEFNTLDTWEPDYSAATGWYAHDARQMSEIQKYQESLHHTVASHPVLLRSGIQGLVQKPALLSDFVSDCDLADNPLYNEVMLKVDLRKQIVYGLGSFSDRSILIVANRSSCDYSDREVELTHYFSACVDSTILGVERRAKVRSALRCINDYVGSKTDLSGMETISPRELEVLQFLIASNSSKAAAAKTGLRQDTYYKHTHSLREKLGLDSVHQLRAVFHDLKQSGTL